jgi:group I intron endonuclease
MGRIIESAGVHVMVDAFVDDSSVFNQATLTTMFVDLVKALDMDILVGPNFIEVPVDPEVLRQAQETGVFADEGGITGTCIISKSHVSLHAWPLQEFFSFDVFSCGDFDPEVALAIIRERMGVRSESVHILNRRKPVIRRPCVYCVTNTVNGKRYIGKSIDPTGRWGHHVWLSLHPDHKGHGHLHSAIAKYGADKFTFHVVEVCDSEESAYTREKWWVGEYTTTDPTKGYNKQDGGLGGFQWSEEMRQRMSATRSGPGNGMFGKHHSDDAKIKMSEASTGRHYPPRSDAHKQAISEARRGTRNNFSKLTEASVVEMRAQAQAGVGRSVLARQFDVSEATVSRVLAGKIWSHVPTPEQVT